jgi:hypothetical protein
MFLPISPRPPSGRTRSPDDRELGLVELDVGKSRPADAHADEVQRRLDRACRRRDREVTVDVAERGVDLVPALGLVDHAAHLVGEQVAAGENPARLAEVEHVGEHVVVAGVHREPVDPREVGRVGLLDRLDAIELGELGE